MNIYDAEFYAAQTMIKDIYDAGLWDYFVKVYLKIFPTADINQILKDGGKCAELVKSIDDKMRIYRNGGSDEC